MTAEERHPVFLGPRPMSQSELLGKVVYAFGSCQIEQLLIGSFASNVLDTPRATHDIDSCLRDFSILGR